MAEEKLSSKLNNKEKFIVNLSFFGGLGFGILGNLLVTATFRWIDDKTLETTLVYILTWVVFVIIFIIIYRGLNKLYKTL